MTDKTCDKCKHYTESDLASHPKYANAGSCALMGDSNDREDDRNDVDKCNGWDAESYCAGVYVGPKFGCIHWAAKP